MKGTKLIERYRLDDLIDAGGVGEVWRGIDEVDDRTVAVKLFTPQPQHPQFAEYLRTGWLGPMATIEKCPTVQSSRVPRVGWTSSPWPGPTG